MRSSPRKMRGEEMEGSIAGARKRKLENEPESDQQQVIIGGTIDKLKTRVKGKKEMKDEDIGKEMMVEDMVMEEEEQVVPLQQERVVEGEYIIEQQGEGESFTIHTQQFTGGEEDVQFEQRREEEEEEEGDDGEDDEGPSLSNMRYKIGGGEAEGGQQMVVQVLPKAVNIPNDNLLSLDVLKSWQMGMSNN